MAQDKIATKAMFTFEGHSTEGFALDWSSVVPFRLASGDMHRNVHVWDRHEAGTWVSHARTCGHRTLAISLIRTYLNAGRQRTAVGGTYGLSRGYPMEPN